MATLEERRNGNKLRKNEGRRGKEIKAMGEE
jgi:hypothetical protein